MGGRARDGDTVTPMNDSPNRHLSQLPAFDPSGEPLRIVDDHGFPLVHVLLSLRDLECRGGEALWATPVQVEDDGYGVYVLRNNSALSAFRMGDLIEAIPGCDAHLRVIGVAGLTEGLVTEVLLPEETPPGSIHEVMETWYEAGADFTDHMPGLLLTAWPEEMDHGDVVDVLEHTTPPDWKLGDIPTTLGRALQLINDVEFCVDLDVPAGAP